MFSTSTSSFEAEPLWGGERWWGGAEAVAEAMKINSSITAIYLARNQIGDAGAKAVCFLKGLLFVWQKTLCDLSVRLPFSAGIGRDAEGELHTQIPPAP